LAEQHHHNVVPVEHRTHDHRDTTDINTKLHATKAQFKDQHVRNETQHTQQDMPTVTGEHVHHHIHETIQPVIQKETIEPHVMHTTVPIHEVHHNKAEHHAASALPAVTMADFKKGGGVLGGRDEKVDHFSGEPHHLKQSLAGGSSGPRDSGFSTGSGGLSSTTGTHGSTGLGSTTGTHGTTGLGSSTGTHDRSALGAGGTVGAAAAAKAVGGHNNSRDLEGKHGNIGLESTTGAHGTSTGGLTGSKNQTGNLGEFSHRHDGHHPTAASSGLSTNSSNTSSDTPRKVSLLDKLNPRKDADGDGKAGFMS
jgi:hypothetical protein